MNATPIAFLVFNRPQHTARVFARIREARPRTLYVIADGPREDKPGDRVRCSDVRRIVEEGIDWPCEFVRIYSDVNLGCAKRVSSGISEVFADVESSIILEDDCVPNPTFFPFCDELLDRYKNDDRVGQVTGCSFLEESDSNMKESYYFSRYPHCWGWATWRRAWQKYDHKMSDWSGKMLSSHWPKGLDDPAERIRWEKCFDSVLDGKVDSWAYRWTYSLWRNNAVSVNSRLNLVMNVGFGPDATHTRTGGVGGIPDQIATFPLVHPADVTANDRADREVSRRVFRSPSFAQRIVRRFRSVWA